MKCCALISGGKDSIFALYTTIQQKNKPCVLIAVEGKTESMMFHIPNIQLTKVIAGLIGLPIIYKKVKKEQDELSVLKNAIIAAKRKYKIEMMVSGAVESTYQKTRIDNICKELKILSHAPLWHINPEQYINLLLSSGFECIFTAVAAQGLDQSWLGRRFDENAIMHLMELNKSYGVSLVGEGGEFETLVVNCPLYKKRIEIIDAEKHWDGMAGWLEIKKIL